MKNRFFLVGTTNWGVQDPHELIRYCSPIFVLCFSSHFWPFTKANLVLENLNKNLGFGQTPPLLGQMPNFFQKINFDGPPNGSIMHRAVTFVQVDRRNTMLLLIVCIAVWQNTMYTRIIGIKVETEIK